MTSEPDFVERLHSAWDRFVTEVSDVIRNASPVTDPAKAEADAAEAAAEHDLDRTEPQSNIAPEPETVAPGDSSVPADPTETADAAGTPTSSVVELVPAEASPVEEPPSNIDPVEDQTGDTVAAAAGTLPSQTSADTVPVEVETFIPGDSPAESVSAGVTSATMPVEPDPAGAAAAAQAEANAHPTVSGQAPMPDDVAQWLAANGLKTEPATPGA